MTMTYDQGRAVVLGVLEDLTVDGGMSVHGLQIAYRNAAESAEDAQLTERTRATAARLRDLADVELLMREMDVANS